MHFDTLRDPSRHRLMLNKPDGKSSPAGLVTRAKSFPALAMKIFVEQEHLPPVRVRRPPCGLTVTSTPSGCIPQKDAPQPTGQFLRYLTKVHEFAWGRRAF